MRMLSRGSKVDTPVNTHSLESGEERTVGDIKRELDARFPDSAPHNLVLCGEPLDNDEALIGTDCGAICQTVTFAIGRKNQTIPIPLEEDLGPKCANRHSLAVE